MRSLGDTDALGRVARVLGIGNPATATEPVDFDDGVLQQVFDVAPAIRRSRTVGSSSGLFWAQWLQAHAGAGQLTDTADPYNLSGSTAGWPSPIPTGYDVWVLGAQGAAATGVLSNGRISIRHPAAAAAFNTGSSSTFEQLVAYWDTDAVVGGGAVAYFADPSGVPVYRGPALRVPRGALLVANTQATGAGDITLQVLLGLFPEALGQDGRA